jgi:hypothetical protein
MSWLAKFIEARFQLHLKPDGESEDPAGIAPPASAPGSSHYADMLHAFSVTLPERVLLALALAPHLAPQMLDLFWTQNGTINRGFSEFGGIKGVNHAGFLPTGETALFLLCGGDVASRLKRSACWSGNDLCLRTAY